MEPVEPVELDPEQVQGAEFLASRNRALLADTMGVGKTAQAIAACDLVSSALTVVVCQAAKRKDWVREFGKFSTRSPRVFLLGKKDQPIEPADVIVCSYEMVPSVTRYLGTEGRKADVMIVDECQYIKSIKAARTRNVLGNRGLVRYARRTWLLSGTPMLNHPAEMWPWLYTLFPETIQDNGSPLGYEAFLDRYCVTRQTPYGLSIVGGKNLDDLKDRMAPIMLRREKIELPPLIVEDLPVRFEDIRHPVDISNLQTLRHNNGTAAIQEFLDAAGRGEDLTEELERDRAVATVRQMIAMAKVLPVCERLANEMLAGTTGKVVVFAIHKCVLEMARDYFRNWGFSPELIWGGTPPEKRDGKLRRFQTNWGCRVLLGQVDATGTGVDGMQHAANEVVFLESAWTPGTNQQAIARVHRRGQKLPVRVRFATIQGTIDEDVTRVIKRKMDIFSKIFD